MKKGILQLKEMFQKWAENHPQIAQFQDTPQETYNSQDYKYPLMYIAYKDADMRQGEISLNVEAVFLDRILEDRSNFINVLSDTLMIANDFYTEFNENEDKYNFIFDVDASATPTVMQYDDKVCGYTINLQAIIRNYRNERNIPQTS